MIESEFVKVPLTVGLGTGTEQHQESIAKLMGNPVEDRDPVRRGMLVTSAIFML